MTRHITCSTTRARVFLQTVPPDTVRFIEPATNPHGDRHHTTAAEILGMDDPLDANYRYLDAEIEIDQLSPLARELCVSAHPRNQNRANDYIMEFRVTTADAERWPDAQRALYGDGGPYRTTFHWPCMHDHETGQQYYERCAELVQLAHRLIERDHLSASHAGRIIARVERWERPWTADTYQLREAREENI